MKKILFTLIIGIFFISLGSAVINVTLPVPAPTNLSATLQSGGSLTANTTYYYVVVAYSNDLNGGSTEYRTSISPNYNILNFFSPLSEEKNFTTNSTHKSAYITWNPVNSTTDSGYVYYQILLTKESGNYTTSGGYETTLENVGTILTNYYNVTSENNGIYAIHTANLRNNLSFGLNKNTGIIKVNVLNGSYSSSGSYDYRYPLQQIYQAVIDAGYGDYVYWDGINFALKGWLTFEGTETTYFRNSHSHLTFIKGGIYIENQNATVIFGNPTYDTEAGADYSSGVTISIQNSRYPLKTKYQNTLFIYGSKIEMSYSFLPRTTSESLSTTYFIGGTGASLTGPVDGIKDNIIDVGYRGTTTEIYDTKMIILNNWGNPDTFRNKITRTAAFCYSSLCRIYATKFTSDLNNTGSADILRFYIPASGANYTTYMYDPIFSKYFYTNNNLPPNVYFMTNYGVLHNNAHLMVFNTIKSEVIDKNGNPLENVSITIKNKNNETDYWYEQDGTPNKRVTGKNYTLVLTDENGRADYYVKSYRVGINQSNTIVSTACNNSNWTFYYPFEITFSKDGYKNYTVTLNTLTKETNLLVSLEEQPAWNYSNKIVFMIRDLFHFFSSLFKIDEYGNVGIKGVLIENTNVSAYDNAFCFSENACVTKNGDLAIAGNLSEEI